MLIEEFVEEVSVLYVKKGAKAPFSLIYIIVVLLKLLF